MPGMLTSPALPDVVTQLFRLTFASASSRTDAWLLIWERLATYRDQAIARHEPLTSTLRVTAAEMAGAAGPVLALAELLAEFDLLTVEESQ